MSKENDEVFARLDFKKRVLDLFFEQFGSPYAAAQDAAALHHDLFALDYNGELIHVASNLPANDPRVMKWLRDKEAVGHLLPPIYDTTETDLADKAFINGSVQARGDLVKSLGGGSIGARAAEDLARRYGLNGLSDYKTKGTRPSDLPDPEGDKKKAVAQDHKGNPFSAAGWNVSKQGALLRAVGREKCEQIAAAVNSRIGATKPSM